MDENKCSNFKTNILLSIITVLTSAVLYLLYRNWLAEDMIQELNRDYRELADEYSGL